MVPCSPRPRKRGALHTKTRAFSQSKPRLIMDVGQATAGSSPCHPNTRPEAKPKGPPGALIFLLAATAGLVVMNIYYNQPILNAIAASFRVGPAAVAWVATATQLGYAAALLLVVPLGDGIDRKWLIIASTLLSCAVLILVPVSPNLPFMLGASFALGFASVAPQLAIPYAAGLVPGAGRGKVVGTVMSGLLIGVLLSRTASGLVMIVAPELWNCIQDDSLA